MLKLAFGETYVSEVKIHISAQRLMEMCDEKEIKEILTALDESRPSGFSKWLQENNYTKKDN